MNLTQTTVTLKEEDSRNFTVSEPESILINDIVYIREDIVYGILETEFKNSDN